MTGYSRFQFNHYIVCTDQLVCLPLDDWGQQNSKRHANYKDRTIYLGRFLFEASGSKVGVIVNVFIVLSLMQ